MTSRHLAGARAKRGYPLRGLLSRTGRCPVRSIGAARSRLPTARPLRGSDCGTRLDRRPFGLTPAGHEAGSRALLGARGFAPLKLTAAWARPALGRRTHASCPAPRFRLPPAPARGAGGAAGACPGPRFAAPVALDIGVADERFFSPRGALNSLACGLHRSDSASRETVLFDLRKSGGRPGAKAPCNRDWRGGSTELAMRCLWRSRTGGFRRKKGAIRRFAQGSIHGADGWRLRGKGEC